MAFFACVILTEQRQPCLMMSFVRWMFAVSSQLSFWTITIVLLKESPQFSCKRRQRKCGGRVLLNLNIWYQNGSEFDHPVVLSALRCFWLLLVSACIWLLVFSCDHILTESKLYWSLGVPFYYFLFYTVCAPSPVCSLSPHHSKSSWDFHCHAWFTTACVCCQY